MLFKDLGQAQQPKGSHLEGLGWPQPEATVMGRRCEEVSGAKEKISDSFVKSQSFEPPAAHLHGYLCSSKELLAEGQATGSLCEWGQAAGSRRKDGRPL